MPLRDPGENNKADKEITDWVWRHNLNFIDMSCTGGLARKECQMIKGHGSTTFTGWRQERMRRSSHRDREQTKNITEIKRVNKFQREAVKRIRKIEMSKKG